MNTQSALRRLTTEKSTARIQQRRGYTKNVVIFRTLGILMLIISTLELTWGALLHFLISAEGIGAWYIITTTTMFILLELLIMLYITTNISYSNFITL